MVGPAVRLLPSPYLDSFSQLVPYFDENPRLLLILSTGDYSEYKCIRCGEGCRSAWRVPVSRQYYEKWTGFWHQSPVAEQRFPFEISKAPTKQEFAYLKKQEDGVSCIFLMPDNQCQIHHRYGLEAKPESCRSYPQVLRLSPQGYAVEYLLKSCSIAPELMLRYPQIYYRWMQFKPETQITLPLTGQMPLPMFYLWLGLVLDILGQEANIEAFIYIIQALNALTQYEFQTLHKEFIFELQTTFQEQKLPEFEERSLEWLDALEAKFFPEFENISISREALSSEEKNFLKHYLWLYFRQAVIVHGYQAPFQGPLTLVQQYLILMVYCHMIQRLALGFKIIQRQPLNFHHLGRAHNLMARRLVQYSHWFQVWNLHQWSEQMILQNAYRIVKKYLS